VLGEYGDSSKALVATLSAGGLLGLAGGDLLVRDADFSFGQAVIIDLAVVAGGLGAAGLTYLVHQADSAKPYMVAGTLGAGVGLGLATYAFRQASPGEPPSGRSAAGPSMRFTLLPQIGLGGGGQRGLGGLTLAGSF
jgi:hypothetical protein